MPISEQNINWFLEGYDQIMQIADRLFEIHYSEVCDEMYISSISDDQIHIQYIVKPDLYAQDYYYGLSFPTKYLWTDDWEEVERHKVIVENLKAIERKQALDAERAEIQRQYDYNQYLKLKEQFEPTPELLPFDYFTNPKHQSQGLAKLLQNQEPLGDEFQRVLTESYWALINESNNTDDSVDNM